MKSRQMRVPALIRKTARAAVHDAGIFLLKRFSKSHAARRKSKHEIVLGEDTAAERLIFKRIKKHFPDHHILSEEAGDNRKRSDWEWIVDPLDGTTNYSFGNPLFATSIAVAYRGEIVFAAINCPAIKEYYEAERGRGAKLNGKRIRVSSASSASHSLLTYCHGYRDSDLQRAVRIYSHYKLRNFDIRQLGCASIEFAWVAKGKTDAYISPGANPWDVAPGALLVREAGGVVVDFKGGEWGLGSKSALAANERLAKGLLFDLRKI